jgi:hypothetical protein
MLDRMKYLIRRKCNMLGIIYSYTFYCIVFTFYSIVYVLLYCVIIVLCCFIVFTRVGLGAGIA